MKTKLSAASGFEVSNFRSSILHFVALLLLLGAGSTLATVRYVNLNGAAPTSPYTSWATAAVRIQDAVDAAVSGDEIVVTNGVYVTGGKRGSGSITNRVAVDKAVLVRSVNGPQFTFIKGQQVSGTTNGSTAIRCVSLSDGASLSGFTLTNGATLRDTGDYWRDQHGGGLYCESTNSLASNCVIIASSAAADGGGVFGGTLKSCLLARNWTSFYGGGAAGSSANGGTPCILKGCVLTENSASYGGGVSDATVLNCTIIRNTAYTGGGAAYTTLSNCIIYYNNAENNPNYYAAVDYCCTTPLPGSGVGNIDLEPQLADLAHLSPASPCRGAGRPGLVTEADFDGEPWLNPPAIGCDEYYPGSAIGPLSVSSVQADFTNVVVGFVVNFVGAVAGHANSNSWDFADGSRLSNRLPASHSWSAPGDYPVIFTAYNESYPAGVSRTVTVHVVASAVHYVAAGNPNAVPPYSSWTTAARNIQDAIDAATVSGAAVLVSNGVYAAGGGVAAGSALTNRILVNKPIFVRSVNGPQVTFIQGYQVPGSTNADSAIRCAYLIEGAKLSGFTLTNGATRNVVQFTDHFGGGVCCQSSNSLVSDCILIGNSSSSGGGGAYFGTLTNCWLIGNRSDVGGGVSGSTLFNCVLTNNTAASFGGGAYGGAGGAVLHGCLLVGNSALAYSGGGAQSASLSNCVLLANTAGSSAGGASYCVLRSCILRGNSAPHGGGISGGSLFNCLLTGNWATDSGGGAYGPANLYNCTLAANSATNHGGGAYGFDSFHIHANCILYNSIIYSNMAAISADCECTQYDCCMPDTPIFGSGNITSPPLFIDLAGGNLRLQSNSPCLNAGNNSYVVGSADLDGRPRIVGGTVDIGAYEFQPDSSGAFIAWLAQYGLPTDGSADYTDPDADGRNNWQEWRCQTNPTNAASVLRMVSALRSGANVSVTWQSVAGVNYFLERSTNLMAVPPFVLVAASIAGQTGTTSYSDTGVAGANALFYRVAVGN